jgi:hypothetical protein
MPGTLVRDLDDRGVSGQACRPAPERRAEREERHVRDPALAGELDHLVVLSVDDAVAVLDRGHVDELERSLRRRPIDVRDPDQIELALLTHLLERGQLLLERYRGVGSGLDQTEIDEVQALHSK